MSHPQRGMSSITQELPNATQSHVVNFKYGHCRTLVNLNFTLVVLFHKEPLRKKFKNL